MLSDELRSIRCALGKLIGKVSEEDASLVRIVRKNLEALEKDAEEMEKHFIPIETIEEAR